MDEEETVDPAPASVPGCLGWKCGTWDECPNCFDEEGYPREIWSTDE